MKRTILPAIMILLLLAFKQSSAQSADILKLKNTFNETKDLLNKNSSLIWGIDLYGPLMFVDPAEKKIYANQQDSANSLTDEGGVFTAKPGNDFNIANTTVSWQGKDWSMVMLPLPEDSSLRQALIIHELFHNVQEKLGISYTGELPGHLEKKQARILLRLEWNALLAALEGSASDIKHHIECALVFRNMRRNFYPGSSVSENGFEMLEGLAEYTGVKLGIESEGARISYMKDRLRGLLENSKSMVRSFAYISGPLYGLLLDRSGIEWRKEIPANNDLGNLIASAFAIKHTPLLQALVDENKTKYGGGLIDSSETRREDENNRIAAMYRKKFIESPVLLLPFNDVNYQFNPMEVISLEGTGSVYPTMRVVSKWGILNVENGAIVLPDRMLAVSAPFTVEGNIVKGDGWRLELNAKWSITSKGNSFTVKQN